MKVRGWVCFHFQFCKSNFCTARFLLGNQFEFHFIDLIPTAVGSCRVYRYGSIKNETSAWYEGRERERERRIERKEKQNSRSAWKEPKVPNPHTGGHTWPRHFLFMIHTRKNNNSRIPAQWEAFLSSVWKKCVTSLGKGNKRNNTSNATPFFVFTVRPHQLHCQLAKAHRCDDVESTVMSQLRVSYVMQQCSTIEPVFFLPLALHR